MDSQVVVDNIRSLLKEIQPLRQWCVKHGLGANIYKVKNQSRKRISFESVFKLCEVLGLDINTGQPLAHDRAAATLTQGRELLFREHPATVPRPYEPTQSPGFPIADPPIANLLVLDAFNRLDTEAQNLVRSLIERLGAATRTQEPRSKYRTPGTKEP